MRWMWIDRFLEFESGRRAVAIKNVSLVEEQMDNYVPDFPVMPSSLIIEGLALTGGLLVAEHGGFQHRIVLAKVSKAVFHFPARAGDQLIYTAEAQVFQPDGALCSGTCHVKGALQADIELMFAHLDDRFQGVDLFTPVELLRMLRVFRLFDVARQRDGTPLVIPERMLAAERQLVVDGGGASSN